MRQQLEVGDRVRPRGVRHKERGRSWLGTVVNVEVSYPVGSDVPYRMLTVRSDMGETWFDDQRSWLPVDGFNGPRAPGRDHVHVAGVRIGWYDVGVWAGMLLIVAFMFLTFPCGLVLGGVPLVMIIWSYHGDRRRENLKLAQSRREHDGS